MNKFLYLALGGLIGFYLAQNKEKETIRFLKRAYDSAKDEVNELKNTIERELNKA